MIGLIMKDLLLIKGNLKTAILLFIVFILLAINGNGNFAFIPAFISVMLFMSTFSYDEFNHFDAYAITMPNGKTNIVKAKYIASMILVLIACLVTFVICFVIGYIQNSLDLNELFYTILGSGLAITLFQALIYPFIFKFGIEKGRIGIFIGVFFIVAIIGYILEKGIQLPANVITFVNQYFLILCPIILIICLCISYIISKRIYLKKQF